MVLQDKLKDKLRISTVSLVILVITLIIFSSSQSYAKVLGQAEILEVDSINVYAEGESLEDAKDKAIKQGAIEALTAMLIRNISQENHWRIPSLIDRVEVLDLLYSNEATEERMTSHSYKAVMNFKFDHSKIRNFLTTSGIKYAERPPTKILLIPVLHQQDGRLNIWNKGPWYSAWEALPQDVGLINYNLPEGDLSDIAYIDPEEVMVESYKKYLDLLRIYEVESMVVVFATDLGDKLEVSLRFLSPASDFLRYKSFEIEQGEGLGKFFKRVATSIAYDIDSEWKGTRVFERERLYSSKLIVDYKDSKEWENIQKKLEVIKIIRQIKIMSKNPTQAELEVVYVLAPAILSKEINKQGFVLNETKGKIYLSTK
jgi:hypothetical protein